MLATSRDGPIVVEYDSRSRAVEIEVESHVSSCRTIILYHEVEFLVASFYLSEVEVEPLIASSYSLAGPIESNSISTSVVDDFLLLVHLGSNSDLLVGCKCQVHIIQTKLAKFGKRYIARIVEYLLEYRLTIRIISKVEGSRQCPDFVTIACNVVVNCTVSRWRYRQLECAYERKINNCSSRERYIRLLCSEISQVQRQSWVVGFLTKTR